MKRLFAFGCSLTYYSWPTWADLLSPNFDEYYNFGVMGMGNQFIHHTVYEANSIFNFTSEDTVLVMFTNPFRNDSFIVDPQDQRLRWQARGFIFQPNNENLYTKDWRDNFWSSEQSYMQTWLALKSVKLLLESKSVNYKLISGISCKNFNCDGPIDPNNINFIQPFYNQILDLFDVKTPLFDWARENFKETEFYTFHDIGVDLHPTLKMHGLYVKQFLPEFCNHLSINAIEELDKNVDLTAQVNNWQKHEFLPYRGKKAGSTLNWQYSVTNEVGAETFKN
jgi:hypothetical protein